jgi:citrate (Re)-synthase
VPALLGRPLEVSLTKESGLIGLILLIRQQLGIDLPKDHPRVIAAYEWVTEQFEQGRQTNIEWEELQPHVHDVHALVWGQSRLRLIPYPKGTLYHIGTL